MSHSTAPAGVLDRFSPATRAWFNGAFAEPTPAQTGAWESIAEGGDTLVIAPTGSGKTLSAFLWSIDRLTSLPPSTDPTGCRVVYISPLKALAVDIERNLRSPLTGVRQAATRLGLPHRELAVSVRTGDTSAQDRRRFGRDPSDILITTPESLFLLMTSAARDSLRAVEAIIVDEIHAVAGSKRGAHLALTLERLDAFAGHRAQRIGLSATVRPVEEVARYLGGASPVRVVAPPSTKRIDVSVVVPVRDMTEPDGPAGDDVAPAVDTGEASTSASIWPAVERRVVDLVQAHRSTIVFVNSRRVAERLTARMNEIASGLDVESLTSAPPAQVMAQSGQSAGAPTVLAKAHHGSVSREQRKDIEEGLKSGQLPAVVATSSLELGIDMGSVDLVVQVGPPPTVASALQRIGRAGHHVGAPSRGIVFPKFRGELIPAAVVAERARSGAIEEVAVPSNPLDVLAQHIVAMTAMEPWPLDELKAMVRRAAPFATLPDSALEATLDMLAGRYPSDDFAELRPRVVWDRVSGMVQGRPGSQRLAVTSGGTIPDRGLFGVFLVGENGGRVGELDEEMVYESRVGDVFTLGSSSWRIEDITADRVLVSPAPGQPGRLPFWHGDNPGRPAELGRAMGEFVRQLGALSPGAAARRLSEAGLDDWAADNLLRYLADQRESAGHLPDDHTIVVERFRDELGDWRIAVHSPYGARVHMPWSLAIAARLRESYGMDVQVMQSDDGIVLRLPDADDSPPGDIVLFAPDEIEAVVQGEVGGSALFASRFRECAARALLLPRRQPGRRTPLWQQRQRSAQLLAVASRFPTFPIVLEAVRECVQDVFDVQALVGVLRDIESRRIRVVEVETPTPSPFARSLLFGYVATFLYDGDAPLAERRAAALSVDSTLLAELLGQPELRELVAPEALTEVEDLVQRRTADRRIRDREDVADLLRVLGDLTTDEVTQRGGELAQLTALEAERRAVRVRIAGEERWIAIEDAGRVRDALGTALPVGVPEAFTEPVADPVGDLVARYARTHGPFTAGEVAARLGLGVAIVAGALARLVQGHRVVAGGFRPNATGREWCDAEVLRLLRRRSLARLRAEVEPVDPAVLGHFLPAWQGVSPVSGSGPDALFRSIEQLRGASVPASSLEPLILPARVPDYAPWMLDELCASGELTWAGAGGLPGSDGWITLCPSETAAALLPPPAAEAVATPLHEAILRVLSDGRALFFRALADAVQADVAANGIGGVESGDAAVTLALWDLVWGTHLTNDTLAPLRSRLTDSRSAPSTSPSRRSPRSLRFDRRAMPSRSGSPATAGRWSLLAARVGDPTVSAHAAAEALLERHGVLTRAATLSEHITGGYAAVYPVLRAMEESGRIRRGYFVETLGAAQFSIPGAVDRLREFTRTDSGKMTTLVLAAADPANPFGAALGWPERATTSSVPGHRPGRKAGAVVVLVDGSLCLYVERGGKSLLTFTEDEASLRPGVEALATAVRRGALGRLAVERADGEPVLTSTLSRLLVEAGFHATPRGLRLRR